jgi:uncharacterized DUF497 family protein
MWLFEWDDTKAATNLAKHKVSFAYAIRVFEDDARVELDVSREVDDEERFKVVGSIDGRRYAVIVTMRGRVCRVISARRTNRQEDRIYGDD